MYLGDNSWDEVMAVAFGPKGCAYATGDVGKDFGGGRKVYKINPDGSDAMYEHGIVGGYPYDIAVDAKGCAYIAGNAGTKFKTTPNAYGRNIRQKGDFVRKLDPSGKVVFSTFIRPIYKNLDADTAVAVDSHGCVYLCRATEYPRERITTGALDTTHNGKIDVYIFKLDSTGSHVIWATYLGGTGDDRLKDVSVDDAGNVYVTGRTQSTDFPTHETALDKGNNSNFDMFVSVLDASGGKLLYSTVMGGNNYDTGQVLVLDQHNGLYIAGTTRSTDFPTTEGAYKRTYSGLGEGRYGGDVFVLKLDMEAIVHSVR
jgi:DNA-binding beta-propeller fold protein YncE